MSQVDKQWIWHPSRLKQPTNLSQFIEYLGESGLVSAKDYWDLHAWSINEYELFWRELSRFLQIKFRREATAVFTCQDPQKPFTSGRWFPDAQLNYAENLLELADRPRALVSYVEGVEKPVVYSLEELKIAVAAFSQFLKTQGIEKGDVVSAVVGNGSEALIAMLGCAAIGAVWSSCSPDFGASSILERFNQVQPKLLVFTFSYSYNGKVFRCEDKFYEVYTGLQDSLKSAVIVNPLGSAHAIGGEQIFDFAAILQASVIPALSYTPVEFNHPLFIMFSSGTTGTPKCIVHGTGGTLLQHRKEHALHSDFGSGKRLLYFTTCGWMMWNWMVSALASTTDLVVFEGSPAYPSLDRLWQVVADEKVTCFGTSPKFLGSCEQAGITPQQSGDFTALEEILSTGAPLMPEQYRWVDQQFAGTVRLNSISGGTDIISCFMLGVPDLPIYPGEITAPGLGMAVESWVDGAPVMAKKGELVCVRPFPSTPLGFLDDHLQQKFKAAYFSLDDSVQVWRHGDFISLTPRGGVIVHGRSDATLNPGGVRIGTAEIYRAVEALPEIADSLAVGVKSADDTEIWLFVVLAGLMDSAALITLIKKQIRSQLSPRHIPAKILAVTEIPYTRSGKKLELSITRLFNGEKIGNEAVAVNPAVFEEYRQLWQRQILSI